MSDKRINTTMNEIINIIKNTKDDTARFTQFIDALTKTIPVKRRKKMQKADPNLDRLFLIKRIDYNVTAKVIRIDPMSSMYEATIISVIDYNKKTKSHTKAGDTLLISKRELELTGRKQINV